MVPLDQYYILAKASFEDDRKRILKHADTFAVFDRFGDIQPLGLGEEGIYHEGTRCLSKSLLLFEGKERPMFLGSTLTEDNSILAVHLTNPDLDGDSALPRGTVHILRLKFLWAGACYEQIRLRNHGRMAVELEMVLQFGADFADIFEVRGMKRENRGSYQRKAQAAHAWLSYVGLDKQVRAVSVACRPKPLEMTQKLLRFKVRLLPNAEQAYQVTFACSSSKRVKPPLGFALAYRKAKKALQQEQALYPEIHSSNEQFNRWLNRSLADLGMMTTRTSAGPFPYAGVPWYSTVFGRDGLITALECLWANPLLARGVLLFLAKTQAKRHLPKQEAEPGKIVHEMRKGEMANLKEIPFGCYYGTADATPLFVMLCGAYYERTADLNLIRKLWPNIELALAWIDRYGDMDRDGFVEYRSQLPQGLTHQGWKDSADAIFHSDGRLAQGAIALCEVQAYVYAAKQAAAGLATALNKKVKARAWSKQAVLLRDKFQKKFWLPELSTYALALDGRKRPCRVRTSNAGHCLLTGIAGRDQARALVKGFFLPEFFSGWGIRTVAVGQARYNPMSYHNGSIWPHDNALIAFGMSRYGYRGPVNKVLTALLDASMRVDLHRLPELFCGFVRRPGEGPTLYPLACRPQAWASACVFMLLQGCLGMRLDAPRKRLQFLHPTLPAFLDHLEIKKLSIGKANLDISIRRHARDISIAVTRKEGRLHVEVVK